MTPAGPGGVWVCLLVMAGGALGALLRHGVGQWLGRSLAAGQWPWATLLVNLLGALAAGFLLMWLEGRPHAVALRALLMVGLLGGLTTFSSLMVEWLLLMREARGGLALGYLAASLAGGMLLVWLGARLALLLRA